MNLQCGFVHRERKRVSGIDLAIALDNFNERKAETGAEVIDGPLAMLYRGDRITLEDRNEHQPVRLDGYVMTWDGRLDNRGEIAAHVGVRLTQDVSDAELVAKAYADVGEVVIGKLIGEFALVVWCERSCELVFARSLCGSRPLYYILEEERILWSSSFEHLVRWSAVELKVNDTYMLEYLFTQPGMRHTPLKNVDVVPSGGLVRVRADGTTLQRSLWNWNCVKSAECKGDQEYEERCLELMREAVMVRLRMTGPLFSELSGGLDSSTVVLLADEALRSRGESSARLKTLSCVYEESESCDETEFIRVIEAARGFNTFLISEQQQAPTVGLRNITFTGLPNPLHSFDGRYRRFAELMREHGARLLLTGLGGDHLFWSDSNGAPEIADKIRRGRLFAAHRESRRRSRVTGIPYFRLLWGMALPLVFDSLGLGASQYYLPEVPRWLADKHRDEVHNLVIKAVGRELGGGMPSERAQRRVAEDLFGTISSGYFNEYHDIFVSHPYTHRPLVEFCVSVPLEQFTRHGETRSLMRRALRNVLPDKTLTRRGKAGLEEVLVRAVQREWNDIGDVSRWRICERGYVKAGLLAESLARMRIGMEMSNEPLLRIFTLERWLRSLECIPKTDRRHAAAAYAEPSTATTAEFAI